MFPLTKLEIGSHCSSIFSSTRWVVSTNLFSGLVPRYLSGRIIDIHLSTRFGFYSWYTINLGRLLKEAEGARGAGSRVYKSLPLGTDRTGRKRCAPHHGKPIFYHVRLKRAIRRLSEGVRGPKTAMSRERKLDTAGNLVTKA